MDFIKRNIKIIIPLLLGFLLYLPTLSHFFLSDDYDLLNVGRTFGNGTDYLTGNYYGEHGVGGSFRPLISFYFAIAYKLFGLNPLGHHLVSLALFLLNIFLVYKLVERLMSKVNCQLSIVSFVSAVLFAVWHNHTESVVWIAAVGDLMATACYLICLIIYIQFKYKNIKEYCFFVLLISCFLVLGLLAKETLLSLPLVLIFYELIFVRSSTLSLFSSISLSLRRTWGFIVIALAYLFYRFWAIGLLFGYYGRESLKIDLKHYLQTLIDLDISPVLSGAWRIIVSNWLFHNYWIYVILFVFLISCFFVFLLKKKHQLLTFLIAFFLSNILLVLPLGLSRFTDEGERYNFLPSIAVIILIAWILSELIQYKKIVGVSLVALVIILNWFVSDNKIKNWAAASDLSKNIFNQLSEFDYASAQKTYFVGLPDNLRGAPVMRNGSVQLLELQGLVTEANRVERIPIYLDLSKTDPQSKLYGEFEFKDDGFLVKTLDNQFIIFGNATQTHPDYKFELWGYNYATQHAPSIRLMFEDWLKARVIYYDEGRLQGIEKS